MVLFLGFVAALVGMMLVSFNSGQVTNAKMRAMNAADAAAYSGAVFEARSLNFQAYMNRAMVVNEVAIAQSVSLRSWTDYIARFVTNVNYITQLIPGVGAVTTSIAQVVNQINNGVQNFLPPFVENASRTLNVFEHQAQIVFNAGTVPVAAQLASNVAQANGAEVSPGGYALIAENEIKWLAFTDTYDKNHGPAGASGDGRKRLRDVMLNSRDGFTRARDWKLTVLIEQIRKQGGTDLVNYDTWKGMDSAALCNLTLKGWKCPTPLGWGGAQAYYGKSPDTTVGKHGDNSDWGRNDGKLAQFRANTSNAKKLNAPLQGYRDLQDLKTKNAAALRIPFAIEVVIPNKQIATANNSFKARAALTDGSTIEHDPQFAGGDKGGVYAVAEACVSFERPYKAERKGATEMPSLFNPYWRASLATEAADTRATVDIIKGLPPITLLTGGKGSCRT